MQGPPVMPPFVYRPVIVMPETGGASEWTYQMCCHGRSMDANHLNLAELEDADEVRARAGSRDEL